MDELEDDTVSVASTEPVEPCWPFWGLLVRTERVEIRQPGTLREIILMKYPRPDFFNRFRSIGERSLGMLGRRTLQEIRSAAKLMLGKTSTLSKRPTTTSADFQNTVVGN